ncbi:hypothetical protein COOONC_21528 [Cooperia oncophora]
MRRGRNERSDSLRLYYSQLQLFDYGAYCPTAKPLTGELLEFVSDPKSKGTILVAFGTVIQWRSVPKEKFEAVLDTLNSLSDYRIVWAYNGKPMTMKPHIYASKMGSSGRCALRTTAQCSSSKRKRWAQNGLCLLVEKVCSVLNG